MATRAKDVASPEAERATPRRRRDGQALLPKRLGKGYGGDYFDRKMREAERQPEVHELSWSNRIAGVLAQAQDRLTREEIETLIGAGAALKDAFLTVRAARRAAQ